MRLTIMLPLLAIAGAAQAAEPILGRWITDDGKAVVTIEKCVKVVCGHIIRILAPTPDGPPVDERNPGGLNAKGCVLFFCRAQHWKPAK